MHSFLKDEVGTTSIEYAVILSAMTVMCAIALYSMAPTLVEVVEIRLSWLALPLP